MPRDKKLNSFPVTVVVLGLLVSSCVNHLAQLEEDRNRLANVDTSIAVDIASCRAQLQKSSQDRESELDSNNIRLLNWNLKKGKHTGWREDLIHLGRNKDFVLLQEAVYEPDMIEAFDNLTYWSFSPGYRKGSQVTGVVTFSRIAPLSQCSLTSWEPWLGTPKATSITEFGLSGTQKTLVIVNFHGVNFAFGIKDFQEQIDQISRVLEEHEGPVIVSGDFNTWRKRRLKIIESFATTMNLTPLSFKQDRRVKIFGNRVDHIYFRGLTTESSSTRYVDSSDHNPMMAKYRLSTP